MEFIQLKCPNCGADLEVENSLDSFFCKYCGTKVMVDGQSSAAYQARVDVKYADTAAAMQKEKHEHIRKSAGGAARTVGRWIKKGVIVYFALMFTIFGLLFISEHVDNKKIKVENERLEEIYKQVKFDISVGDYDSALVKANTIRWTCNKGNGETWDETREEVIRLIYEMKDAS